jgi:hypothetical protein
MNVARAPPQGGTLAWGAPAPAPRTHARRGHARVHCCTNLIEMTQGALA